MEVGVVDYPGERGFSTRVDSTRIRTIRICTRPDFCRLFFSVDFKLKSLVYHSIYHSYVYSGNFFFLSLFVSFFPNVAPKIMLINSITYFLRSHRNIVSQVVKYFHGDDGLERGRQPSEAAVAG